MSTRSRILAPAIIVFAVIVAAIIYNRPYFRGARILPAAGRPEVTKYAEGFADSLSISTRWNTGEPLSEPHIYLQGGDATSPDGQFTLRQRRLRSGYHEITVSRGSNGVVETVLVIQEGDPGSGTSHGWFWSSDSQAVFIYGSGTPAGHAHTKNLALIYIVQQRTLYSIDLKPHLSKRLNAKTNAPNNCVEPSAASAFSLPVNFLVRVSRRSALAHANR